MKLGGGRGPKMLGGGDVVYNALGMTCGLRAPCTLIGNVTAVEDHSGRANVQYLCRCLERGYLVHHVNNVLPAILVSVFEMLTGNHHFHQAMPHVCASYMRGRTPTS